jgi:hypothetical protein
MPSFDQAWAAVALPREGEPVSHELRPLLRAVYTQILSEPVNGIELKRSLKDLLLFLAGEGRTNANCWAVDLFFSLGQGWERDWAEQALPEDFREVLATMGTALHDTVKAPDIANNLGCLPEQLLEDVKRITATTLD